MSKESISISNIRQDEWVNPFGATPEELIAGALEESGLMESRTLINGKSAQSVFQAYCNKKSLFQEATRLGNILMKEKLVTKEQLSQALQYQAEHGTPLGEALVAMSICTEDEIALALAHQQSIREDYYRMEQQREARRHFWTRIVQFFWDSRDVR